MEGVTNGGWGYFIASHQEFDHMESAVERSVFTSARQAILDRVVKTANECGEAFPYYAHQETGDWQTTPDGNWCGGHWIGLLWLAHEQVTDDQTAAELASLAHMLTDVVRSTLTPETMFRGMNMLYAGFRAYDICGDRALYGLGFDGADAMIDAFNEEARQVPLGEFSIKGPENFRGEPTDQKPSGLRIGAVDNVYTALSVLWRAYEETGNPQFRDVAVSHADRHLDWYIRDDGSTWHHAVFDRETGNLQRQYNELAHSDETCWARGQGWNIAGLARAYRATDADRYHSALKTTTDYYVEQTPEDLVPYWDFELDPTPETPRDTSAAALTAYGLTRLPDEDARVEELRQLGKRILVSLVDSYLVDDPTDERYGMITRGCFNKPGEFAVNNELIWTNYYVSYTLKELLECERS